jgi:hypothetical protein
MPACSGGADAEQELAQIEANRQAEVGPSDEERYAIGA